MKRALILMALVALAGCKRGPSDEAEAVATDVPKAVAAQPSGISAVESRFGTPVKDRVATLGLLNKRNNLSQDLVMKTGETRRVGNVIVRLATCERTLPWERPPEVGAFVQVYVEDRARADERPTWRKVFSGWLFKNSPSLNVVEHPVYDVWVKDCAMKFPGEEEEPSAAATSTAKPSGRSRASASPAPSASPEPGVSPSPAATPSAAPE
jgi:hypothetical protein